MFDNSCIIELDLYKFNTSTYFFKLTIPRNLTGDVELLASVSEHFQINDDKSLVLTYEGLGTCESSPISLTVCASWRGRPLKLPFLPFLLSSICPLF